MLELAENMEGEVMGKRQGTSLISYQSIMVPLFLPNVD